MNVLDLDQHKGLSESELDAVLQKTKPIDVLIFNSQQAAALVNIKQQNPLKGRIYKLLQTTATALPASEILATQPDFIINKKNQAELEKIYSVIESEQFKSKNMSSKKSEVIKKSEELELFNESLSKEFEKKIELIKKFLDIEEGRKKNEKKLLYFLDHINLEISRATFVQSVLHFIWKENSCSDFAMMIGFQLEEIENQFTVFFDGKDEKIFFEKKIDFNVTLPKEIDKQFANFLKRPTGNIQRLHLQLNHRTFNLFYEVKNADPELISQKNMFFQDRLSILSMAVSNWLMDHRLKIQVEIWDYIFKNWSDPVHLIDGQYRLIKSNYFTENSADKLHSPVERFCYKILAGQEQPCAGCPVKDNTTHGSVTFQQKRFQSIRSVYQNANTTLHLVFYQDKTSADLLKKEFIQSEKLKLLGQLSNHLSHELNNPLTGLKLKAEFMLQQDVVRKSPAMKEDFTHIVDGLQRSIDIIQDLQSFSDTKTVILSELDISKTIQSVLRLLKSITREVRLFIDAKRFLTRVNHSLLQQTLYNLIKNSCEALGPKGTIKIYSTETDTQYVLILEDDGPGLPEMVKNNLFKPFVSTRENKGGTGLGLYIAFESCKKMNIDFQYDMNFKNGTRFKLVFKK